MARSLLPPSGAPRRIGAIADEECAFGWLAHSRNSRLRLFTEDTQPIWLQAV
jgi:hypothetical protein